MAIATTAIAPGNLQASICLGSRGLPFARPSGSKAADAGGVSARASDDTLMAAVKQGDERAYDELMNRHVNKIYNYLFRMTGAHADSEDLTQETFLRVWQKAHTYQPGRVKVSTWIHRIAHNLCVDTFRRHRELTNVELPETAAPGADQVEARQAEQSLRFVEQAIGKLPQNQRSALVLCQIQGFSNADAAKVLGVNVRALESLLARARRQLRTALATGEAAL